MKCIAKIAEGLLSWSWGGLAPRSKRLTISRERNCDAAFSFEYKHDAKVRFQQNRWV